jgi:uncharacterized protein
LNAAAAQHDSFQNGSYLEFIRANLYDVFTWFITYDGLMTTGVSCFGLFLLGYYAGRSNLLEKIKSGLSTKEKKKLFATIIGSLIAGVIGQAIPILDIAVLSDKNLIWVKVVCELCWRVGFLSLSLFYMCSLVLLYQRNRSSRILLFFAPVGRMALTNYLAQSVVCVFIFYGIGLGFYGQVGPTICILLTTFIFIMQVFLSNWWLTRFQFGPVEWLWRVLTYGNVENMRLVKY